MSPTEAANMVETGLVQESTSGLTHVAYPANAATFGRQAPAGSVYTEFNVPTTSLRSSSTGTASIPGPNSVHSRAAVKAGEAPLEMPAATNIRIYE